MTSSLITPARARSDTASILSLWLLLGAQFALFVWSSRRGFSFTDEAFYVLSALHWRDALSAYTFSGALLELPFELTGQRVDLFRVFGLSILIGSGVFCALSAVKLEKEIDISDREAQFPLIGLGVVSAFYYYSYLATERAPSYNLIVLASLQLSTGVLFRLVSGVAGKRLIGLCVLYGASIAACSLAKASSAALVLFLHVAFFVFFNSRWNFKQVVAICLSSLFGGMVVFWLLSSSHPAWVDMLVRGVASLSDETDRSIAVLIKAVRYPIQRDLIDVLPWLLPVFFALVLSLKYLVRSGVGINRAIALGSSLGVAVGCSMNGRGGRWFAVLLAGMAVLAIPGGRRVLFGRLKYTQQATLALLLILPLVFSFGTNVSVLQHSQSAAGFVFLAIGLQLTRMKAQSLISGKTLALCIAFLCVPSLVGQLKLIIDPTYNQYLLARPLVEQNKSIRIGSTGSELYVDERTYSAIHALRLAVAKSGFEHGDPVLNLTAVMPGLTYVIEGHPLGPAWIIVRSKRSPRDFVSKTLQELPVDDLRRVWILALAPPIDLIPYWPELIAQRLGEGSHELIETIPVPPVYGLDVSSNLDDWYVQVWRPRKPEFGN